MPFGGVPCRLWTIVFIPCQPQSRTFDSHPCVAACNGTHWPPATYRGRQACKEECQKLPNAFFQLRLAEVQTTEGKLYLYVGIDRTSKLAFVQLVAKANRVTASAFLVVLTTALPYRIHMILTDNGIQFRFPPRYANGPMTTYFTHIFTMRCRENGIEHWFTKPNHPWGSRELETIQWIVYPEDGQVERMSRAIKDATVKRYHYDSHDLLRQHLDDFVSAYNFARRLKILKGLTPYEFICECWT